MASATVVAADTDDKWQAGIFCNHTDFELKPDTAIDAAILGKMRVMDKLGPASALPEGSTQKWLANVLQQYGDKIAEDMDQSLIQAQSLDSTSKVKRKYPVIYGVRKVKPAIEWPESYAAKPLTQCFVRTNETGISQVSQSVKSVSQSSQSSQSSPASGVKSVKSRQAIGCIDFCWT